MIVKGIIKTIDFRGNTCTVRIPVLENSANGTEVVIPAVFSMIPGLYNGYKVNDVVFVAFENDQLNSPVVISKLYLGADTESKNPRGAINADSFKSTNPITIPMSTKLTLDNDPHKLNTARVKNGLADFKSISDIIRGLQVQTEQIGSLDVQLVDTGKELGAKVNKTQDAKTTGFGWNLTNDSWILQAYNSDHGFKYTDIFKATQEGVEVTGTIKVKDFPRHTRTTYAITDDDTKPTIVPWDNTYNDPENPPRAPWSLVEPEQTIGKRLWVATTVWIYTLNETTQTLEETVETTIQDGALLRYTYYYKQVQHGTPAPEKPANNTVPTEASGWVALVPEKDSAKDTYRCTQILEDDDDPEHGIRHITYIDLILLDTNALIVEQGKSTTYYSDIDPCELGYNVKYGDCWVDTNITLGNLLQIEDYIGTYIKLPNTENYTLVTEENINTPAIYNFLNNWLPQTVVQVKYVIDESTGERIEPAEFHPEDYFVKLDYKFIDLVHTAIMYKEDIQAYGRSSIDSEDRFVYIGREPDPDYGIINKWRKQNTINNEFVDTDFIVYTNDIARQYSPADQRIIFTITQEQLDDDIRVAAVAYNKDTHTANYLKQWVGDHWEDVGGEIVANKVTAAYINALDITAKRIEVKDGNDTLFLADASTNNVTISGFEVTSQQLSSITPESQVIISPEQILLESKVAGDTGHFDITKDGKLTATNAEISGAIKADSLSIGGIPFATADVKDGDEEYYRVTVTYSDNRTSKIATASILVESYDQETGGNLKNVTKNTPIEVTIGFFIQRTFGNTYKTDSRTITILAGQHEASGTVSITYSGYWIVESQCYFTYTPKNTISKSGNFKNTFGYFLNKENCCTKSYIINLQSYELLSSSFDSIFTTGEPDYNHDSYRGWNYPEKTAIFNISRFVCDDFKTIYGLNTELIPYNFVYEHVPDYRLNTLTSKLSSPYYSGYSYPDNLLQTDAYGRTNIPIPARSLLDTDINCFWLVFGGEPQGPITDPERPGQSLYLGVEGEFKMNIGDHPTPNGLRRLSHIILTVYGEPRSE